MFEIQFGKKQQDDCVCMGHFWICTHTHMHDVHTSTTAFLPVCLLAGQVEGGLQTIMVLRVPINGVG